MIEQSFIVVHRREGYEKVYQMGNNLMKAICLQKAVMASDVVTDEMLSLVKDIIKQEEIDTVLKNLNTLGRDRVHNSEEEEAYIIAFPAYDPYRKTHKQ